MVRMRLVVLVTVAALIAPRIAPCVAAAPAGHAAMPCCQTQASSGPAAGACCVPADGRSPVPAPSVGSLVPAPAATAVLWPPSPEASSPSARHHTTAHLQVQPRVQFSVLLI